MTIRTEEQKEPDGIGGYRSRWDVWIQTEPNGAEIIAGQGVTELMALRDAISSISGAVEVCYLRGREVAGLEWAHTTREVVGR